MVSIYSVQSHNKQSQACVIEFENVKLVAATCLPLYTLQHFKAHNNLPVSDMNEQSKQKPNLVFDEVDGKMLFKGPTLFDVSYLDRLDLLGVRFILLCDYRDILTLPYLTKNKKCNATILLTYPMYQMGRLLLKQFYSTIKNTDRSRQSLRQPNYFQESYAYDLFEEKYGLRVEDWSSIYSDTDINAMLERCVELNFGQVYSECGLQITPYSSGSSMATAMWTIESQRTKYTMLYAQNLSVHSWRHCLSAQTTKLQFKSINTVILGRGCIKFQSDAISTTDQLKQFLESIQSELRRGKNCTVLLNDLLDVLDLLDILNYRIPTAYKQIYVYNPIFQHLAKYANSLVEYLNVYLKGKIYSEPPAYPFSSYDTLVEKGRISFGTMQKVSINNKVSLKELLIRHQPSLNFELLLDNELNPDKNMNITHKKMYDRRAIKLELKQWLNEIKPSSVYSYEATTQHEDITQCIAYESKVMFESPTINYYKCESWSTFPIKKFKLENNQLIKPDGKVESLLVCKTDWPETLREKLNKHGITAYPHNQDIPGLKTSNSQVELCRYTFNIHSTNAQETEIIYRCLMEITQRVSLSE